MICHHARLWVLILGLSLSAVGRLTAAESPLTASRAAVEKWIETHQLISKVRSDWQSDKETLEQSVLLFERELKAVAAQISKVTTNSVQVDKERAEAEVLKKTSSESLERARLFAAEFEGEVKKIVPRLPVPLQDILKPLLNRIPTDPNARITAAERLQTLVGILNELDKFNNAVSVFNEKRRNPKGEEVAVETVYIGLGAAYFVNQTDDFAGIGFPAAAGWEWTGQPELAHSVRDVLKIYRNERPAKFISLPTVIR